MESNGDLPEADFWLGSLRVHLGYNFRVARDSGTISVLAKKI